MVSWTYGGTVLLDENLDHFGNVEDLLHIALLHALLWDRLHNFNGLLHHLRNGNLGLHSLIGSVDMLLLEVKMARRR